MINEQCDQGAGKPARGILVSAPSPQPSAYHGVNTLIMIHDDDDDGDDEADDDDDDGDDENADDMNAFPPGAVQGVG